MANSTISLEESVRTVGPAIKEVPESAIAEQPLAQNPEKKIRSGQYQHVEPQSQQ